MSMRIFSLASALAVSSCGSSSGAQPAGEQIACALDGAAGFARVCSLERSGSQVTVRRPDGGFRRFEIVTDGGLAALDGAGEARETVLSNGMIEAQIDGDRYRFRLEAPGSAAKP
ncbi:hypothetical protein [Novosphingobium sp. Gsoil 351]|uniref:hypothetical protein n=1 Tax=Novosphingobium sp. Gsoil 351 TaxID=2675225 RepID=UPI0012B4ED3F|nr:hypothetical protein [Novosphingobium sp. Gsoil 351]QGN53775.1 hypothetical protein GKE62_03680 [Novosphingobium sp. Gsoil 351]